MAFQPDLVVPPIIIAMLILMVLGINSLILESSVDNRLANDMQTRAALAVDLVQEEVRGLEQLLEEPDSTLRFFTFTGDSVVISQRDKNLKIIRKDRISEVPDTVYYDLDLKKVRFASYPDTVMYDYADFIKVNARTQSNPDHHARFNNTEQLMSAVAEKKLFLRHKAARSHKESN
ncbi:hypothetical protein [Natronogracilivirga saccharolytica]|uniref:Uncharacterized protein n=1 Tax=Natronogracilivirga saccharolytica TaxID=2812953 RepID=A0A8J7RLK2_9BACT|nr:hypothetical protein [Natronogracilivirga saccharolytica]MBP3191914.1 hypothetical protein [Natronogracilivirga saccharolytica]